VEANFSRQGDLLVPSMSAVSVWSQDMVNGHQIGGLVAWAVERDHSTADMQASRLTVDMFRPVPMKPLRMETSVTREGRRLRLIEVSMFDGDVEVTRGSVLLLARSESPSGEPWSPPEWDMPPPEELAGPTPEAMMSWEVRRHEGWDEGRGRVWMRELVAFVEGEEISPLVRAALAADFANPLVNGGGPSGLAYINADLTLYLTRDPVDEWVGMEAAGHMAADGVAVGTAWLYDRNGRIGHSSVAAMPDARLRERMSGA
jgi:hypothetical protein